MNWTEEDLKAHYDRLKTTEPRKCVCGCPYDKHTARSNSGLWECRHCGCKRYRPSEGGDATCQDSRPSDRPSRPLSKVAPVKRSAGAAPRDKMNKTEKAFSQYLELLRKTGDIYWWEYEGMTLKLAFDTRYTPDFSVIIRSPSGILEVEDTFELQFFETKGFMREDANVKLKVAATKFPFRFFLVHKVGSGWDIQEVKK